MKSHKETLGLLNKIKQELKKSKTIKDICKEYGADIDYIDLIPMAFADLDVSARTDKGVIYFNYSLFDDFLENNLHYGAHELTHHFQQCWGDGPTQGAADGEYLENEFEQEGFQNQTKYLSETRNDEAAKDYVLKVLDHHNVPPKERKEKLKDLLTLADN